MVNIDLLNEYADCFIGNLVIAKPTRNPIKNK